MTPDPRERLRRAFRLAGLAAVSILYLRTLHLPSLWLDEAWEANYYVGLVAKPWYNRPMLYMLSERLMAAFDSGEFSLRLLPCLAGIGAVAATFHLGKRLSGEACGWIAGALIAFSEPFLAYAHQLKHYTYDALFTALLVILYERYRRARDVRSLAWWVLAGSVSFGFSFTTPFVIAGIAAVEILRDAVARRRPSPAFSVACATLGVVFAAVFSSFHSGEVGQGYLRDFFVEAWLPVRAVGSVPGWWAHQTANILDLAGGSSALAVGLILAAGLIAGIRSGDEPVGAVLLTAMAGNVAASALRLYPYGDTRTSLYLAPLVCLAVARGLTSAIPRGGLAWPAAIVAAGLVYPLFGHPALAQTRIYSTEGRPAENIRAAVAIVADRASSGDGIIVTERASPSFVYYWYRAGKGTRPPNAVWINRNRREPERNAAPVREAASKHDTIWCYLSAFTPPERRVVRDVLSETHERVEVVSEEKDASLELYRRRSRSGLER